MRRTEATQTGNEFLLGQVKESVALYWIQHKLPASFGKGNGKAAALECVAAILIIVDEVSKSLLI